MTEVIAARCRHCRMPLVPGQGFCSHCGAAAQVAVDDAQRDAVAALFAGDLAVEQLLGRGAMGAVYRAFDPALQRRVAVKVLLPEIERDAAMAERFLREARTAAALQHPHVVAIHAVRAGEAGRAIVMQFVDGRSLDAVLAERPRLPLLVASVILSQVASALQHAHERGVVHRDVKPANVLLDADGRAIVTDFGIARREGTTRITDDGMVVGTIAYMAPEVISGGDATAAADQYALGVMAFELLGGRRPFEGNGAQVMRAHVAEPPPSLAALRPDLPAAVVAVVERMLAKAPAARWPDLREATRLFTTLVADADAATRELTQLSRVAPAASRVVAAARPPVSPPTAPRVAPARVPPSTPVAAPATPAGRRWLPYAAIGGVVVVGLAGLAVVAARREQAPSLAVERGDPAELPASPAPVGTADAPGGTVAAPPAAEVDVAPAPREPQRTDATPGTTAAPVFERREVARVEPAPAAAPAAAVPAPPAPTPVEPSAGPPPSVADARAIGRQFVTLVNQRRARDLESLPGHGGDAAARAELLRLIRGSGELAAGFDRIPSAPDATGDAFTTEFALDLEVGTGARAGRRVLLVEVMAVREGTGWRLAGWRVAPTP
jgi:serine/threonine-protein kinase